MSPLGLEAFLSSDPNRGETVRHEINNRISDRVLAQFNFCQEHVCDILQRILWPAVEPIDHSAGNQTREPLCPLPKVTSR